METPVVRSRAQTQEKLENLELEVLSEETVRLENEMSEDIDPLSNVEDNAAQLISLLQKLPFQAVSEAPKGCASTFSSRRKNYLAVPNQQLPVDVVPIFGIYKRSGEPLGMTLKIQNNDLVIARIFHGGIIDQLGLLHVGDIIKEVNGYRVRKHPKELVEVLKKVTGSISLKILPGCQETTISQRVFVKCHFDYDPNHDTLIPCKEAGLKFSKGDILQLVNLQDPNWWQARPVKEGGRVGLIPSQSLEEKRKAFVSRSWGNAGSFCGSLRSKKKKKIMYRTTKSVEFEHHEIQIYEEMANMPPFQRKVIVLIGAQGVGRRCLKNRFIDLNPTRFGTTIPFTSRHPKEDETDGKEYRFMLRHEMELDIKAGKYLEHGEYQGNLYGTRIDSILEVFQTGRSCILDVNPRALKVLRTSEFMPFVIFIAAPKLEVLRDIHKGMVDAGFTSYLPTEKDLRKTIIESARILKSYNHYFDLIIVNDNLDQAFDELQSAIITVGTEPQWIPISWLY